METPFLCFKLFSDVSHVIISNRHDVTQLVINKTLVIIFQEIQCTNADKLLIPNFSLAGSALSRKHSLAVTILK